MAQLTPSQQISPPSVDAIRELAMVHRLHILLVAIGSIALSPALADSSNRQMPPALRGMVTKYDRLLAKEQKLSAACDASLVNVGSDLIRRDGGVSCDELKDAADDIREAWTPLSAKLTAEGFDMNGHDLRTAAGSAASKADPKAYRGIPAGEDPPSGKEYADHTPPNNTTTPTAEQQADIDAEVRGDIEDNRINNSASAADDGPITAPTDEATLAEFIGRLKARYIGKPSGLVTKELSAIAFTGRAQDVQIGDEYCRPWVAATFHGKCGDNQPTLRCEPSSRNGENSIACYNLGGIKNTDLRFVTKYFMSRTTQRTYTDFMTYAAFKVMADQYAANPASDPARSPPPADMTALVPPPSETSQTGQSPSNSSTGNADLDGLKNDYAATQTGKPSTQAELDSSIGSLTLQLGNQVVDFSGGSSPSLGAYYEKVSTEGIVPDTARCTATVSRVLGDCRRSTNALGCSGINIYAMNERQKHTTTCYELWGVTGTNLRFVMAYSYWDAEDAVRYGGTLMVAAYRNLRQVQANDEKMLGEGMKMFNDMLSGSDNGRCALATNGTTGEKPPGCP